MARLYTAELSVYDPSIPGIRTLYFCTELGLTTRPSDSPPNTTFEPRITQPANVRVDAFAVGTTSGRSEFGLGDLVLANSDGALDAMIDYGIDGREIILRVGEHTAPYPTDHTVVMRAVMEYLVVTDQEVRVRVRPRDLLTKVEFSASRYDGNNILPNGLEGVGDIAGKPKPRVYGQVTNISPVLVNSARLIYQVNDGPVEAVTVYDGGLAFGAGAHYTSQADMEANAPSAGQIRLWPTGGYFRLGSSPTRAITADVTEGATAADRTAAAIARRILEGPGGTTNYDAASFLALDTANSGVCGIFMAEEAHVADALDRILAGVGAFWSDSTHGYFVARLEAPVGTPVATFDENNIITIEREAPNDATRGVPPHTVVVRYGLNYTVQTNDLAGGVTAARRGALAQEWRAVSVSDPTVLIKHLLSQPLEVESMLQVEADALAEASRLMTLHGVRRDLFNITVALDDTVTGVSSLGISGVLELGSLVSIQYARYGLDNGKLMRVIGYELDARLNQAALTLWG